MKDKKKFIYISEIQMSQGSELEKNLKKIKSIIKKNKT